MNNVVAIEKNPCPYPVPTVKDIIKKIESAIYRIGKYQLITDVLECGAIAISNTVDFSSYAEREEQYKKVMEKYQPEEQKILSEVFTMIYQLLSSVVYDDGCFDDYLGELFMRCEQGNSGTGQFFTPYHVSKLMAKMILGSEVVEKAEKDEVITVNDPCCGGGGMLMAALDVLKNDYHINYTRNCFIDCGDIDRRCVYMTYLQLSLAGVPAIVKHQDAISRELWSVWRTPAYIFQYSRFGRYENLN